jgi:predicted SnoaL-like aldol condensation-catalyzing enzyme
MKYLKAGLLVIGFVACVPTSAQDMPSTMTKQEKANVQMVLNWWREVIVARHLDLAPKYQAEDYIQHNPNIPTGRAAFVKFFGGLGPPTAIPDRLPDPPAVAFGKGDYVVLVWNHSAVDPANPARTYTYNSFDCLRIQNGKVQEHWDDAQKQAPSAGRGR